MSHPLAHFRSSEKCILAHHRTKNFFHQKDHPEKMGGRSPRVLWLPSYLGATICVDYSFPELSRAASHLSSTPAPSESLKDCYTHTIGGKTEAWEVEWFAHDLWLPHPGVLSTPLYGDYSSPACFNAQINCCPNHLLKASWGAAARESPRRAQHPGSGINRYLTL